MNIKDFMNKSIVALEKNTPLVEVAKVMNEQDIGMVLIKDEQKIIGVLTDRDIVTKIIANNDSEVKEYYSKNIITVDISDDLPVALQKMTEHKVKRLVVTNQNKVVGIISLSDLSSIPNETLGQIYKEIWRVNRNTDTYITKINEFEL